MAQLIKLNNYISRYELDIYRYAGQFPHMKKQRWQQMLEKHEAKDAPVTHASGHAAKTKPLEPWEREFHEDVFFFQLRWARSTLREKSQMDSRYRFDGWLKFFLQQFPDNYLLLYRPVLQIRQAPVELDILIVGPMALWCVTLLEGGDGEVFQGASGRFWSKIENGHVVQHLSPLVSNLRMARLVKQVLMSQESEPMPVKRMILSPLAYIEYPDAPADVEMIDRRRVKKWYAQMIKQPSPLKFAQLKTAEHLLNHCQTQSSER